MWKAQTSPCLLLQTSDESTEQDTIQQWSEMHFSLDPSFKHNFHVWHQIPHPASGSYGLLQHSGYPPPIAAVSPCLTSPSTSSTHSSDWQLNDTTSYNQTSLTFASAKQTGIWLLLHALTTLYHVWLLHNMISLDIFLQLIYLLWCFWVTGVTGLHETSIWMMLCQLLIPLNIVTISNNTCNFHRSWEFWIIFAY